MSTQIDWADAADPAVIWEGGQVELGGTEGQLIMATISRQLLLVWMHLRRCAVSIALRRLGQSQGGTGTPVALLHGFNMIDLWRDSLTGAVYICLNT